MKQPEASNSSKHPLNSAATLHPALLLLGLTIALLWCIFLSFGTHGKDNGADYVDKLRAEFKKISPPDPASAPDNQGFDAKSSSVYIESDYHTSLPLDTVLTSYRNQLTANGWAHAGLFDTSHVPRETYCKGPLAAELEIQPSTNAWIVQYRFSMYWNQVSVKECTPTP